MRYANTALYERESVLIPRKGTLSNAMYINGPFWVVDTMFYTEMRIPNIAKYVYYFVKGLDLDSMNVGSAVPSMTTEVLNNLLIRRPPIDLFKQFDYFTTEYFNKIKTNHKQIRTLTSFRNTLLPKLMNGDVKIKI